MNIVDKVLNIFYPTRCVFCETVGEQQICPACRKEYPYLTEPRCKMCGKPLRRVEQEYCRDCNGNERAFECGRNLWLHRGGVSDSLYRFKYQGVKSNGRVYAEELAAVYENTLENWEIEQIIPIPLHRRRLAQRGFNQAEVIAVRLGRMLDLPVNTSSLIRQRHTRPQKVLNDRERWRNIRSAFRVKRSDNLSGNILIVDDIYTTGSTLNEAAKCLKDAGVRKVFFLTISIGQGI